MAGEAIWGSVPGRYGDGGGLFIFLPRVVRPNVGGGDVKSSIYKRWQQSRVCARVNWCSPLFSFLVLLICSQAPPSAPWPLTCVSKGWDLGKTVHSPFALVPHGRTCGGLELCACPGAGELFFSYQLTQEENVLVKN